MTQPDGPISDDLEAPEADAVEQATLANPVDAPRTARVAVPLEANEADVAEQSVVVEDPDEDYR